MDPIHQAIDQLTGTHGYVSVLKAVYDGLDASLKSGKVFGYEEKQRIVAQADNIRNMVMNLK